MGEDFLPHADGKIFLISSQNMIIKTPTLSIRIHQATKQNKNVISSLSTTISIDHLSYYY
jgi:hypothetical protein